MACTQDLLTRTSSTSWKGVPPVKRPTNPPTGGRPSLSAPGRRESLVRRSAFSRSASWPADATNDWAADDLQGRTTSELVADLVPGARVVKAGNTLGADVLGSDPQGAGGRRVIFISGDDADAKADVVSLFQDAGFAAIDLGGLATGGAMQQIHHPLASVNLIQL
jgi:hypothetical protein